MPPGSRSNPDPTKPEAAHRLPWAGQSHSITPFQNIIHQIPHVKVHEPQRVILSRRTRRHERGEALLHDVHVRDLQKRERRVPGPAEPRDDLAEYRKNTRTSA